MTTNQELLDVGKATQLANYRPAPFVLTRGEGCRVFDVEGNAYLDLAAGIAVSALGHGHPVLTRAIAEQAGRLMHVSNLFYNDRAIELAKELTDRTPFERVFFCNSGSEANEAMLKLARRFHHDHGAPERREYVAATGSFHGRTLGSLSVTGQAKYHAGMEPLIPGVHFVPYNDLEAMRGAVTDRTAAVIVEPLQGEGGIVVGDDSYLQGLRELCDERGALLLFDEVQTGIGRTGRFLAREWSGVTPDACSLAKGIGGGFPLGAMLVVGRVADGLPPGTHATTFGGNALACAAGLAVLRTLDAEELVAQAEARGRFLEGLLKDLVNKHDGAVGVRGRGLLWGVVLGEGVDPAATLAAIRSKGVLLSLAGGNVLRFSPPLIVSEEELSEGVRRVSEVLGNAASPEAPAVSP
ncbi:MAG: aspartate aminotransferase family protein [Myxococcales bacterium]|nr:aspartate aminotransferase family protein [Myxococcales bacterium]